MLYVGRLKALTQVRWLSVSEAMRRRPAAVWVAAAEIPGELCVDSEAMIARAVTRTARAARTQRWVSVAALESKVTTDEAKQELNRLKMALGASRLETGGKR